MSYMNQIHETHHRDCECGMCDQQKPAKEKPLSTSDATACSSVARHYGWTDKNMAKGFETWEAEVAHVEAMGYKLVPPEYYIPHWSTAMQMGDAKPKIYVLRNDGPDEVRTHFDCYACQLGYPVYYRTNSIL